MKSRQTIIISCEHGGNRVPREYQSLFRGKQSILQSHRGRDQGALELAQGLAAKIKAPLFSSVTTRLLVDLNRSLHHRHLFSEFTRHCNPALKTKILEHYYYPYRTKLEDAIRKIVAGGGTTLHLSVHSFTPRLRGQQRRADVGLLYDPRRPHELDRCCTLQNILRSTTNGLIVRRNYPYRGTADGFTTDLRKKYGAGEYLGIEIEINQKHVGTNSAKWDRFRQQIIRAVELVIQQ
jgi:predicted N-formylglutamate amidohydrolase